MMGMDGWMVEMLDNGYEKG